MPLRLAYLGVANVFALLRLLPVSNQNKDAEILALRHQITVLERQLARDRVRFAPSDRVFLAALLHRLPRGVLRRARLLVRPDTVLRWHRDLVSRRHAARSRPGRAGRPRTVRSIRVLVLRLARENPGWGYRRIHGELLVVGVQVAASTVWEILKEAGIDPAPERGSSTWTDFLRSQADALLACDFFEAVTLSGARLYVFAVIGHADRRIRVLGATAQPTASWVAQAARNLVMDLEGAGCRARFMIRDRDGKYPALFDTVLEDAGIEVVLSGIRMPRMNALVERWVQACRRELLDRTLVWNQRYLLHALREFEQHYNSHRPHQGIADARPLHPPASADHRPGRHRPPRHTTTRPPRRHPPRVPACGLTCTDEILGRDKVESALFYGFLRRDSRYRLTLSSAVRPGVRADSPTPTLSRLPPSDGRKVRNPALLVPCRRQHALAAASKLTTAMDKHTTAAEGVGGMQEPWSLPSEVQRLQGHTERAFVEVQRADTKATALCGIAGGLLAAGVAVLSSADGRHLLATISLVLMCLLLIAAIGAALLALRPVVPRSGLRAELMSEAAVSDRGGVSADARGELERHVEAHRLQVLAWLADRKLRSVRLSVDFALAALLMAGMCLLNNILVS